MRIRSIRPEFWSSEDVAAMDWHTRLVYIGLWSYVDDNGVGRDLERLILTDLFPLDESLSESSLRVHAALNHLETHGQITRYTVNGKPYLHVTAWEKHQRINRPTAGRYPLPTAENATPRTRFSEPSVSPHAKESLGEGEKGRRGEGEKTTTHAQSQAIERAHPTPHRFEEFWNHYPRKVGRDKARPLYQRAAQRVGEETIIAGAHRLATDPNLPEKQYIPHPTTWLNRGGWNDEPLPPRNTMNGPAPANRVQQNMDVTRQLWEAEQATNQRPKELGA